MLSRTLGQFPSGAGIRSLCFAVWVGLLVAPSLTQAFTYVMMKDEDLLAQSDLVVTGEVQQVEFIRDDTGRILMSRYHVSVSDTIKGDAVPEVTVQVPGANAPGENRVFLFGAPHYFEGDRVLLFLDAGADGVYRPEQFSLGTFAIKTWNHEDYAVRLLFGTNLGTRMVNAYNEPSNVRALSSFTQWMKQQSGTVKQVPKTRQTPASAPSDAAPADYFVTDPMLKARLSGLLTPQYTLISSGTSFRWTAFDNSQSVTWKQNGGLNYTTQISQALTAWNNASGSNINMVLSGTTTASEGLTGTDGTNTILFGDPNNEIGGSYSCTSGGTLGMGGPFSSGLHTYNNTSFNTTVEGDVVIQDGAECFLDQNNKANAEEIVGHEVGHALGFGHSCGDASAGPCDDNPTGDDEALMRASAHGDGRGAQLGTDDIAAAAFLYAGSGGNSSQPPQISQLADVTMDQDTSSSTISITVSDPDGTAGNIALSASFDNTQLLNSDSFAFGGSGTNRTLVITPVAGQTGSARITITATDESGLTATTQFTLTVNAVNQPPTISAISDQTLTAGQSASPIAFTISDSDDGTANLILSASSSNIALLPTQNIQFGGSGSNRTITLVPVGSGTGTSVVTVTVSDGQSSASTSFTVTVVAANVPPTISSIADQVIAANESTGAISFTISDQETSASALTVTAASDNTVLVPDANIQLGGSGSTRTVTVTPVTDASGTAVITLTVSDGEDTSSVSFTLTVEAANQPPTISAISDQVLMAGVASAAIPFTIDDPDDGASNLTVSASSSNIAVLPTQNIQLAGTGESRTVTLVPVSSGSGTAVVTLTVSDGQASTSTSFTVTVEASTLTSSTNDNGSGSLRTALANADAGDTIQFDDTLFPQDSDPTNNPVIQLETPLTITQSLTIDGDLNDDGIPDVTLQGSPTGLLELTGGTIRVEGVVLKGHSGTVSSGIVINGGANVTLSGSEIEGHTADTGSALSVSGATLTIEDTRLTGNVSGNGGSLNILGSGTEVTIRNASIDDNATTGNGGAILNEGGTLTLTNTTIAGNQADGDGAALYLTGGGQVTLNNVTITENTSTGSAIFQDSGATLITNSIITDNITGATGNLTAMASTDAQDVNVSGGTMTVRYSGIKKSVGNISADSTNLLSTDIRLEPVSVAGIKKVYRLTAGSAAIDAGDPNPPGEGGTCATTDIVGKTRPIDGDGDFVAVCDLGAFEYDVLSDTGDNAALVRTIQEQYIAFYGRPGDPGGVRFWVGELARVNGDLSAIQNQFGTSQEFSDLIVPGDATTVEELTTEQRGELINNLYQNMFGRDVEGTVDDPLTGLGFWTSELEKPEVSLIDISTRVADGAQNDDRTILDNRVRLAQRISEEFVIQGKDYTEAHITTIRQFIADHVNDAGDDPETPDVASLVSSLE